MEDELTIIDSIPAFNSGFKTCSEYIRPQSDFDKLPELDSFHGGTCCCFKKEYPPGTKQYIAYKKLLPNKFDMKSYFREVYITNQLSHPCTSELIAFNFGEGDTPYIVTKFYSKGSLDNLFIGKDNDYEYFKLGNMRKVQNENNQGFRMEIDDGTVYTILMYSIARGLRYMHTMHFFHRDVKIKNIFIDEYNIGHISDFGFSKPQDEQDLMQSKTAGTVLDMAPEIFQNSNKDYNFPSDVYSLSLVFYTLTEAKPDPIVYQRRNQKASQSQLFRLMREYHSHNRRPQFYMTPEPLRDLISWMWERLPECRPTMDQVCKELEKPEMWFPNTNPKAFEKFKKRIDEFEQNRSKSINSGDSLTADTEFLNSAFSQATSRENIIFNKSSNPMIYNTLSYHHFKATLDQFYLHNAQASYQLGLMYITGFNKIPKDYELAWTYFEDSFKNGNKSASEGFDIILNKIHKHELKIDNESPLMTYNDNFDLNNPYFQTLKSPKSKFITGMIHEAKKEFQSALRFYLDAVKGGIDKAKYRIGSILVKLNKLPEKREKLLSDHCENSKINSNERNRAKLYLALSKFKQEKIDDAIQLLNELINDDHPDAALLLAISYHRKGMIKEAEKFYQIASIYFAG